MKRQLQDVAKREKLQMRIKLTIEDLNSLQAKVNMKSSAAQSKLQKANELLFFTHAHCSIKIKDGGKDKDLRGRVLV